MLSKQNQIWKGTNSMIPWKCAENANSERNSILAVAGGWEDRKVENILKLASGDDGAALWIY